MQGATEKGRGLFLGGGTEKLRCQSELCNQDKTFILDGNGCWMEKTLATL